MARSRRLGIAGEVSAGPGRAREILAFLGEKVGKLYFWEKVVSTFPLALFDHFQNSRAPKKHRAGTDFGIKCGHKKAIVMPSLSPSVYHHVE